MPYAIDDGASEGRGVAGSGWLLLDEKGHVVSLLNPIHLALLRVVVVILPACCSNSIADGDPSFPPSTAPVPSTPSARSL